MYWSLKGHLESCHCSLVIFEWFILTPFREASQLLGLPLDAWILGVGLLRKRWTGRNFELRAELHPRSRSGSEICAGFTAKAAKVQDGCKVKFGEFVIVLIWRILPSFRCFWMNVACVLTSWVPGGNQISDMYYCFVARVTCGASLQIQGQVLSVDTSECTKKKADFCWHFLFCGWPRAEMLMSRTPVACPAPFELLTCSTRDA